MTTGGKKCHTRECVLNVSDGGVDACTVCVVGGNSHGCCGKRSGERAEKIWVVELVGANENTSDA